MLRIAGMLLICGGCLGLGGWYGTQMRLRLWVLHRMAQILELMMGEIRYSKATLPECCLKLGKRLEEPFSGAFFKVHEEMEKNEGNGFEDIFEKEMEEALGRFPLKKEEKELFCRFSAGMGFEGSGMQLDSMEQCRERLKGLADGLETETAEKSRMVWGLGAMSGLLLVILLL